MKKIAITMGDPAGIGPEIIIKALSQTGIREYCRPIIVGDRTPLEEAIALLKLTVTLKVIKSPEEHQSIQKRSTIEVIEMGVVKKIRKGKPTVSGGKASVQYIKKAVELALDKHVDGIVTAPISKEALHMAGFTWPGHTEMLSELTHTKDYAMMFVGGPLRIILVTIHIDLKKVPSLILKNKVLKTIRLARKACEMLGLKKPRIAVAGLNPHAGEAGLFGDEEIREIGPAVKEALKEGIPVAGPFPPDVIFHKAYKGEVDLIVCMYHDQGLIPLKMVAFERGVNITVGLPIIRTSPDHGTAYDIAWKGIANPSSMIEAIKLATKLKI
jgi:4-hydroxythreonine-4-phosphate dehydrogenase